MGGQSSGRQALTTDDWMRRIEKRLMHEERRPQIRTASDLMGPGLGPKAIQIFDWNDDITLFNGFFYSDPGPAQHSPDNTKHWMGYNVVNLNGNGYQRVYEYRDEPDVLIQVSYTRRFKTPPGLSRIFEAWVLSGSGSGGGGGSALTIQDEAVSLDTATALINFTGAGVTAIHPASGQVEVNIPGSGAAGGGGGVAFQARSTSTLTLTTNVITAVPGATITVGVSGSSERFLVVGNFDWSSNAATATTCVGYLYVDGVQQSVQSPFNPGAVTANRNVGSQVWLITGLSSGTHVFDLRATNFSALGSVGLVTPNTSITAVSLGLVAGGTVLPYGNTGPLTAIAAGGFTTYAISWSQPLPDTNYIVSFNGTTADTIFTTSAKTTTGCTITARNSSATAARDPGGTWLVLPNTIGASSAGGVLPGGYAEITANSTVNAVGLVTTSPSDVPGLSVSVALSAARRYKVTFDGMVYGTVTNDRAQVALYDGASLLTYTQSTQMAVVTNGYGMHLEKVLNGPTTGTHVLKVALGRQSGTGVINLLGNAVNPTVPFILVEDIGAV